MPLKNLDQFLLAEMKFCSNFISDIVNFAKSGFDTPLLEGQNNLTKKQKRKVDKDLSDLAPTPKKTQEAQEAVFASLPSAEDGIVAGEVKRRKTVKTVKRRSLF